MAKIEEPSAPSGKPSWWDKLSGRSDTLTDAQITTLMSIPQVYFSPYIMNKFKFFIKKNWAIRQGKKTPLALARELDHTCAREYLTKLKSGGTGFPPFDTEIQQKLELLEDSDNDEATKQSIQQGIDTKLEEISKLYTEGPFTVFKNNLVFNKSGIPIGVREGDDQKRFAQCHQELTEQNYTRTRVPVGPDVTSSPYRKTAGRKHKKRKTLRKKRHSRR